MLARRPAGPSPAHRCWLRALARAHQLRKGALDEAVVQRVKGDDGQPAAGRKQPRRRVQQRAQRLQLPIHSHAQRLEAARGGMCPAAAGASAAARAARPPAPPVRFRGSYEPRELRRAAEGRRRRRCPGHHHLLRHRRSLRLLPILPKQARKLQLRQMVHQRPQ